MAKPTSTPRWATAPSDPGDIVEPSSGRKDDGFNVGEAPPAGWFNWLFNLIYQWLAYLDGWFTTGDELVYPTGAKTRKFIVPLWSGITYDSFTSWSKASNPQSNYFWQKKDDAATMRIVFPIGALLREGMTITAVQMLIRPGDGRTAVDAKIGLYYANPTHTGGVAVPTPVGVGTQGSSSGTALQVVAASLGGAHTVVREGDSGRDYWVEILGTDATGGGANDLDFLYGIELTVTDPGPRNV